MKSNVACCFLGIFACILGLLPEKSVASPPSPGELEKYAKDGTLEERIAFGRELGNDRYSPQLVRRAKAKMELLTMEQQGVSPDLIPTPAPPPAWRGMPTTGNNKVLCLLVEFNDVVHTPANTRDAIHEALFGNGQTANVPYESVRNFYQRSSYNKLNITGNTLGWYRTAYNRSAVQTNYLGREALIKEVLNYYNAQGHDFTQYDNNGDGEVDLVFVIYAGGNTGWNSFWWAYQTSWSDSSFRVDNKRFGTYVFQYQNQATGGNFNPRTAIHETGHALGLPDLYDYRADQGPNGGVGGLDMMHSNLGDHNCFHKWMLDWLTPTVVSSGTSTRSLRASGASEDCILIMPGGGSMFSEIFMVQNRTKVGNDNSSLWPGGGMMIWHIDSTLDSSGNNFLYNNSYTAHKMVRLMEADGLEQIETTGSGDAGDFYVSGKSFTPNSTPNSRRYNGTATGISISNFSPAQDTMSALFSIGSGVAPTVSITAPAANAQIVQTTGTTISANAADSDGVVASVSFYVDGALLAVDTVSPYSVSWTGAAAGNHVLTAVAADNSGLSTTSAVVPVVVTASGAPANDNFANRITISGNATSVTGTNSLATAEAGEPLHAGYAPRRTVWWSWTPSISGVATIDTLGSDFDTVLAAYTGTSLSGLSLVAANDDEPNGTRASVITFPVTAGTAYRIAVDGYNGLEGSIVLTVSANYLPPPNDNFANAEVIPNSATFTSTFGTTNGAGKQSGELLHHSNGPWTSVWYQWTAPSNGQLEINTLSSNFDTVLAVYTGTAVNALTKLASNNDTFGQLSEVWVNVTAGTTYRIAVDGFSGATGAVGLHTNFFDDNDPPTISLAWPRDGSYLQRSSFYYVSAEAYDPEGRMKEVRFYRDGVLHSTVPATPGNPFFDTVMDFPTEGAHTITATAVDEFNLEVWVSNVIYASDLPLGEVLDNYGMDWLSGPSFFWSGTTAKSHDGQDSARSGAIGHNQASTMRTTVSGPGAVSFWWAVSSEANYDYLSFFIDGVLQTRISGSVDWSRQSWTVPAGEHELRWTYSKDGSVVSGQDAGWVDQVSWLNPPDLYGPDGFSGVTGVPFSGQLYADAQAATYSVSSGTLPPGLTLNATSGAITGSPTSAGTYAVTFRVTNEAGSDAHVCTFTVTASIPIPVAVEAPSLAWTTGGNTVWYGQTALSHDGVDAARNGPMLNDQSTWVQTTVTGPGTLLFWWRVSSEAGYDYLRLTIDGVETPDAPGISGETAWQQIAVPVPAGSHTIRWTYSKDYSVTRGEDSGFLDQVSFYPGVAPVIPNMHLRFDESSGTFAADSSGNGWNGTLVSGANFAAGKINNGLNLGSSNQSVTLPAGVVSSYNNFTIATWVKLNSVNTWSRIFDFGSGTGSYMMLTPRNSHTGKMRWAIRMPGVTEQNIDAPAALASGSWQHVAVSLSGTTGTLYLNGSAVGTNTAMTLRPSSLGVTTQNYIGDSQYSVDPGLNGLVDEFQIFGRALSATEIAALSTPTTPEIAVEHPAGTNLTSGTSLSFGTGLVGSAGAIKTFTIRNLGGATLSGLGYSVVGTNASDYQLNTSGSATSLTPGGTTTCSVRFAPGAIGARSAELRIASNDSDENPFSVPLTGTGAAAGQLAQEAFAKAANVNTEDEFGYSIAVSGETVVVGARHEDSNATGVNGNPNNESATEAGAAYVFVKQGETWVQQAYLKGSNTVAGDRFGVSVAISGDTIVVGALQEGSNGNGAAYVFTRSGTVWTQQAYLTASNGGAGDQFGSAVSISGNSLVVGARYEDSSTTGVNTTSNNSASNSGAAYVFVRNSGVWTQQAYLKASNADVDDDFGFSASISGDTVVVGAGAEDSSTTGINNTPSGTATDSGAAYVFVRSGSTWSQQAFVKASNTGSGDRFGRCVAISGDTFVTGARFEDSSATGVNGTQSNNSSGDSGAAYVFVRSSGVWTQQAYLKASNTDGGDEFGFAVDVFNDRVVVGARYEESNATGVNGIQSNDSVDQAGAAYVFTRAGTTWSQHSYLKASNTGTGDTFGWSVSLSNNVVAVGAPQEGSSTTGVNPVSNNSADDSGAAYIFNVIGGTGQEGIVYTTADFGPGSLRDAVENAAPGSTISFDPDLSGQSIQVSGASIAISSNLVIDASDLPGGIILTNGPFEGLLETAIGTTVELRGMTFSGDSHGINNGGTMIMSNCAVRGCATVGIYNYGQLTLADCVLERNGDQAVICEVGSGLTADRTKILFNNGYSGGGVLILENAHATLRRCVVNGNKALNEGGGIAHYGNTLLIEDSDISGNRSEEGGGIFNLGHLVVDRCSLTWNTSADLSGGAIRNIDEGVVNLMSSTIAENFGAFSGGGIVNFDNGVVTLDSCTVCNNRTDGPGGGIRDDNLVSLTNSIVAGNHAGDESMDYYGFVDGLGGNNLMGNTDGSGGFVGMVGDPWLSPLEVRGGITLVMVPRAGSPAINQSGATSFTTDQRGFSRSSGGGVDLGAAEAVSVGAFMVNTVADENNGTLVGGVSLRDALAAAAPGDPIIFAPALSGQTIQLTNGQLAVRRNILIDASGLPAGINISGNNTQRVFHVEAGATACLRDLRIIDGFSGSEGDGGGILNEGITLLQDCSVEECLADDGGGGIYSAGFLALNRSSIAYNDSNGYGAGVASTRGLVVTDSAFIDNDAVGGTGGGIESVGHALIRNSTFAYNGANGDGGGIWSAGQLVVRDSTVSQNSAIAAGGIFADEEDGSFELSNSIVAGNSAEDPEFAPDVSAAFATQPSVSFVGNPLGFLGFTGMSGDAMLSSPGAYGGPTMTMLPLPGSPVIDAGNFCYSDADQRGEVRPSGLGVDIGAVEVAYAPPQSWAHLRLNENSGTLATDASGNGRNGTLSGGASFAAGKIGNAATLGTGSQRVALPAGIVNGLHDFAICAWVKPTTVDTNARIFDFGNGTSNSMYLTVRSGASSTIRFGIRTSSVAEQSIDGFGALPAGVWSHVAVTMVNGTGYLWVNGTLVGADPSMTLDPSSLGSTAFNYLGDSQSASDPNFNGQIDEFQIFNRGLSAIEIANESTPSTNANLSALGLTAAGYSPGFSPAVQSYSAAVPNAVTSTQVIPWLEDADASVTVNGVGVANAGISPSIPLNVGLNTITCLVAAADGVSTRSYTLTVTRAASNNADLAALSLSSGTLSPGFAGGTSSYTASVPNATGSITVTPTAAQANATIRVNSVIVASGSASGSQPLAVGPNTIAVQVTAQDGSTIHNYSITVTRAASSNADLSALALNSGSLSPSFAAATTTYTSSVTSGVSSLTLTPTAAQANATIKVNGVTVNSGTPSSSIALNFGANTITTQVTAQDGTTVKTYTLTVTRAANNNADLSGLVLSSGTLNPAFAAGTITYTASVSNAVSSLTVTPTAAQAGSTIRVNTVVVASGSPSSAIPLAVGPNTVTTQVTAQDGVTVKTYTVTVTRAASSNADLSGLALSSGTLNPVFAAGTLSYSASVSNAVSSLTVTPTAAQANAAITVNSVAVASGSASSAIALNVGPNTITTQVTAQDGITVKTYTVTVTRAASSNADLASLTLSSGTLNPTFAAATTTYTAGVSNAVSSLTVTPTAAQANATIRVNTVVVASGSASAAIPLNVGANNISVQVTAQDGTTVKTYAVTVTRATSSNADLSGLVLSSGTLAPSFAAGTTSYTASVSNAVASLTVTPSAAHANAAITVNSVAVASGSASSAIPLNVGSNTVTTQVTAQDGITVKTYTVTVTRAASSNADLASLTLSSGTLNPAFAAATTTYTAGVSNAVTSLTVTPTAAQANATIRVNTVVVASGSASAAIPLNVGANNISVQVTAQDGTTVKSYTVTVTRAASNNADLSGLTLSSGTLAPPFAANTTTYSTTVPNEQGSIIITPDAPPGSVIRVNNVVVTSGTSITIPLNVGLNTITIQVTAQDGTTVKTYTLTVTRAASSNADLSALALSSGTLNPAFAAGTTSYTAGVSNAVTSLTVTPTAAHGSATIRVNSVIVASGSASTSIPLNVGANAITTEVTAQDGTTVKTYTVTVTRGASNNADLSGLALSSGTLAPSFAAGTTTYTASVPSSVTSLTVTPTAAQANATIRVNSVIVASGSASSSIPLNVGQNTITAQVTAQDGTTVKTYTVTVTRAASNNADLSALTISAGTLSPPFFPITTSFTASVGNAVSSVTVTATAAQADATIRVNSVAVLSGIASGPIPLNVGSNTITVQVTAQDGITVKTYTITVTRAASNNADLSGLVLSSGTLAPPFAAGSTSYIANVSNAVASITVTPTAAQAGAVIRVNGVVVNSGSASSAIPLDVGPNTITTQVTAQDSTTVKTYTVTVTRAASNNADLSGLALGSGTLAPTFSPGTTSYTAGVSNAVTSLTVTPTAAQANATIRVNSVVVASGSASAAIPLSVGPNTITTQVTAQDGTTVKTYTVTVTRAASNNADLSGLALSSGTLAPTFTAGTTSYTASVGNAVTSLTVMPTAAEANATIRVNSVIVPSGSASGSIALSVGTNTIITQVTAQDGTTVKTYAVVVTRAGGSNADLAGLAISSGTLSPAFSPGNTAYAVNVPNLTTAVTFTPTLADPAATVRVNGNLVASGTASPAIVLSVGDNGISILVTAQDGVTGQTYFVNVTRAGTPLIVIERQIGVPLADGDSDAFGKVPSGVGAVHTFIVRNLGTASLGGLGVSVTGPGAAAFSPNTASLLTSMDPGEHSSFTLTFDHPVFGGKLATLQVTSNDSGSPLDIFLSGTVVDPNAEPHGDDVSNLLKYAFNMNMDAPDRTILIPGSGTAGLPSIRRVGAQFRVEFIRRTDGRLVYTPRISSDLVAFTTMTGTPQVTPVAEGWERVVFETPADPATYFGVLDVTPAF